MYGEKIVKSVGAKSGTYPTVNYPDTSIPVDFVPGTRPVYPPDHTMAGGAKQEEKLMMLIYLSIHINVPPMAGKMKKPYMKS